MTSLNTRLPNAQSASGDTLNSALIPLIVSVPNARTNLTGSRAKMMMDGIDSGEWRNPLALYIHLEYLELLEKE